MFGNGRSLGFHGVFHSFVRQSQCLLPQCPLSLGVSSKRSLARKPLASELFEQRQKGFLILHSSLLHFPTQARHCTWESTENVYITLLWAEPPEAVHTIKVYSLLTSLASAFWMEKAQLHVVIQESGLLPSGGSAFLQICRVSIKLAEWVKRVRPLRGRVSVEQIWVQCIHFDCCSQSSSHSHGQPKRGLKNLTLQKEEEEKANPSAVAGSSIASDRRVLGIRLQPTSGGS